MREPTSHLVLSQRNSRRHMSSPSSGLCRLVSLSADACGGSSIFLMTLARRGRGTVAASIGDTASDEFLLESSGSREQASSRVREDGNSKSCSLMACELLPGLCPPRGLDGSHPSPIFSQTRQGTNMICPDDIFWQAHADRDALVLRVTAQLPV